MKSMIMLWTLVVLIFTLVACAAPANKQSGRKVLCPACGTEFVIEEDIGG